MSRDSDVRLRGFNNVNKFTYNIKSQLRDLTRPP